MGVNPVGTLRMHVGVDWLTRTLEEVHITQMARDDSKYCSVHNAYRYSFSGHKQQSGAPSPHR